MFKGKTALISGGSRGIGAAIALELARLGANIAIIYAGNQAAAQQTCANIEALGVVARSYQCDVSNFNQTADAVKKINEDLGPINILVNNAGMVRDKLAVQMSDEDFSNIIDVNLKGAFNLIRHTYSGFVKQRAGRIINITSVVGIMGNAGQANYSAAKAGLIGLTKSIAKELAGRGITCNAIAPGFIETDMTENMPAAAKEAHMAHIPLKRAGSAHEVAQLVAFLASDAAGYITGTVVPIDGGLSM